MKTVYLVILGVVIFTLVNFSVAFASCGGCNSRALAFADNTANGGALDAGNKICPVMGNPIEEATKVTYEYEGRIYNFCCTGCIEAFKKETQKYIDRVNQELGTTQTEAAPE